jgi:hypothetical protein
MEDEQIDRRAAALREISLASYCLRIFSAILSLCLTR